MRVLVVNAGSSSLKLSVLADKQVLAARHVDRWEGQAEQESLGSLLSEVGYVDAVGHRIVHGGPGRTGPAVVDDTLLAELEALVELAPLHQPRGLAGVRAAMLALPGVPQVACFDTAFHRTIPAAAATYALPAEWNARWGLRRYGFHGLSHAYAVGRAAEIVGRPLAELRVVSCHLGAGSSLCAVQFGRSVDTTMGFTPLAGLVMATRSGSLDPGMLLWLLSRAGVTLAELSEALEHSSGLAGLSGTSGDLRDVVAARDRGDAGAALAEQVFAHRLAREAGGMAVSAGGLDLLVLTGGIGEHMPEVRAGLAARLAHLRVRLDDVANATARADADISAPGAPVRTVVVTAGEDAQIAGEVEAVLEV